LWPDGLNSLEREEEKYVHGTTRSDAKWREAAALVASQCGACVINLV
jgi:hypothetical protein